MEIEVEIKAIQIDDVVIAKDRERIPVDGSILVGSALVNWALITGESSSVEKIIGDKVHAGSM